VDDAALQASGWWKLQTESFSGNLGPLWVHDGPPTIRMGFSITSGQANDHVGTVHGAALMTLADTALGYAVTRTLGAPNCVTLQLQLHFISAGHVGEFVFCVPEVMRKTSQVVFMRGTMSIDDRIVATADGIWKVLTPRPVIVPSGQPGS